MFLKLTGAIDWRRRNVQYDIRYTKVQAHVVTRKDRQRSIQKKRMTMATIAIDEGSETNDVTNIKTEDGGYTNPDFEIELEVNGTKHHGNKSEIAHNDSEATAPKFRRKKDGKLDLSRDGEKKVNLSVIVEDEDRVSVEVENEAPTKPLLYKISDTPPISLTMFFAIQQTLLSIIGSLIVPFLVADAVCAQGDNIMVTRLLSTTMMLNGITSLMQTVLGVRLPLFQGPSAAYIVPLQSINIIEPQRCDLDYVYPDKFENGSLINGTSEAELKQDLIYLRIQELIGPLVVCGIIHCLIGFTGLVGILMRFVGPITIIPTLVLIGIYIVKPSITYVESHWGVAVFTWAVSIILSLYLGSKAMPIPLYSKKKGFRIIRYPLHQVFALLISIFAGWILCGILTAAGAFTDDPTLPEFNARTDARDSILTDSSWFYFPYPGQFGAPKFGISAFIGFIIATVTSILDSIGDYYACAGMCRVPPPPGHATNRGIAVEGFCTIISGFMGAGHATTTYGGNIGAIGMTKVASRRVFVVMALIYMVFGVFSKLSALFVSIPYPVLGGILMTVIGVFVGLNLSNLQVVDLGSTRNLSVMGMGIFIGYLVPSWIEQNPEVTFTGNGDVDQALKVILGNPNFVGTVLSCFLDNTVPGTAEERGIAAWRDDKNEASEEKGPTENSDNTLEYLEGSEIYDPLIPARLKSTWVTKYLPIFPYKSDTKQSHYELDRRQSMFVEISSLASSGGDRRRSSAFDRRLSGASPGSRRVSTVSEIRRESICLGPRRKSVISAF